MKFIIVMIAMLGIPCISMGQLSIGDTAIEIRLPDTRGIEQKLTQYRGKLVLVDFWASWCVPCRKSNKELAPLYAKYKAKGFEIFGISVDDEAGAWKKAIAVDKIKWTQVHQKGGWDAPVAVQWRIEKLPTSYLLDKEGRIIEVDPTKEVIESYLKSL